eukprot:COSAG02_NODE_25201_length_666_cov_0.680776_1_plen_137_part_10
MAGIGSAQFMQKGIEKIKEATAIDTQVTQSGSTEPGRYDAAVSVYMTGIEYFNHALKCESSPPPTFLQVERWRGAARGGLSGVRPRSDVPLPPLPLTRLARRLVGLHLCRWAGAPVSHTCSLTRSQTRPTQRARRPS